MILAVLILAILNWLSDLGSIAQGNQSNYILITASLTILLWMMLPLYGIIFLIGAFLLLVKIVRQH